MLVYEFKAYGKRQQYKAIDDAIRTGQFIDSNGKTVANPRFLRKSEARLKKAQRRLSKKKKGSKNRGKARNMVARSHLKISRQRKDWVTKLATC